MDICIQHEQQHLISYSDPRSISVMHQTSESAPKKTEDWALYVMAELKSLSGKSVFQGKKKKAKYKLVT